jgi:hypothetical protein
MKVYGRTIGLNGQPAPIMQVAERLVDQPNIHLRWGGDFMIGAINGSCPLLNGLQQLQRFTANNVPTVEYTTDPVIRDQWMLANHIIFGRKLHHTQGKDIVVPGHKGNCMRTIGHVKCTCKAARRTAKWLTSDFWVKYIASAAEWRMHILKVPGREQKVVSIARGLKTYSSASKPADNPIIRSRRLGWTLQHTEMPPKGLRQLAKQAMLACGYDLGAVDILVLPDSTFKVLEVNSRPAVRDEYTIEKYVSALRTNYGSAQTMANGGE